MSEKTETIEALKADRDAILSQLRDCFEALEALLSVTSAEDTNTLGEFHKMPERTYPPTDVMSIPAELSFTSRAHIAWSIRLLITALRRHRRARADTWKQFAPLLEHLEGTTE